MSLEIQGDEAKHAVRTKRLAEGDTLELLTGAGQIGDARISRISRQARPGGGKDWVMSLQVEQVRDEPRTRPQIHLRSGVPKGPRLEALIEAVSQAGAASWAPLETRRSVVDPRPTKLARMQRVAAEASKQCGRAWMLEIQPSQTLATFLERSDRQLVIADAAAPPYQPTATEAITLLIGPEGGFEPDELDAAIAAGATPASFGPHTMRIETACAIACAVVLDAERRAH
jgi:16S rRNA (uracil1498-N3)-methyltransferase